ncbi:hypothetical protein LTR35_014007 [Friedmanniomyces endolithicus]|uniref:Alcohol dehydrogenase-like C-terminal domain-containing protein n=1 Tax=Friedmanniomyces endolithicus TaxID=329885 RepID=A0AAN6J1A1_9PEZI|nr:hypothetical protein LTR35_014007 [Friedmanniomyces endolithicus]KAK0281092.1 hypothetical protein LTS00_012733 [Friedmanniomyces endolithicus]KAK0306572.1 hypothetical protein LTR82_016317 [Friedmanniomyces endolithicus]KAK0987217.1 hypothetical protein LTR54_013170 [Friedmanniomyces endolithicus]
MTAAVALYARLRLPAPWLPLPAQNPPIRTPLVIYGASSAIGSYAIQFAQRSNIHPLICIAGHAGASHVSHLISPEKGDVVVDYRAGAEAVVSGIRAALREGEKLEYAFDAVSEKGSYGNICQVLDHETGAITFVLPGKKYEGIPAGVRQSVTTVGSVHGDLKDFGGLEEGWFRAQPQEVVEGGLGGLQGGLERLRDGKVSAVKCELLVMSNLAPWSEMCGR